MTTIYLKGREREWVSHSVITYDDCSLFYKFKKKNKILFF